MHIADNPFLLENTDAYRRWRSAKLADYPQRVEDCRVDIADPQRLTPAEHARVLGLCRKANLALYRVTGTQATDKAGVRALGRRFGLERLDHNLCADPDGIAALRVSSGGRSRDYIPYSNKPINWHTDGYYNPPEQWVRGVILHCAHDAAEGGENAYLDHEIAYILLRDADPGYIEALTQPDVMSIPPNLENGVELRAEQSGPVFSLNPDGSLHMRYTARARNIRWKPQAKVQAALDFLQDLFNRDATYIFRYRLNPNEGVICNNVLHNRAGFSNDGGQERLLYRARYFDRVAGCGLDPTPAAPA